MICQVETRKSIFFKLVGTAIFSILISGFLHNKLINYLDIYHTILEAACIFIALSLFMSVLYTFDRNSSSSCILGFGYMAVAAFDIMHVIFHFKLNLSSETYFDLSTKFWILGRITEAIVLLLSVKLVNKKFGKMVYILTTTVYTVGIICFVIVFQKHLPVFLTEQGVTKLKAVLEYQIIGIFILALIGLKGKLNEKSIIEYKYIFISLAISISSEMCFSLYSSINSSTWTLGHVLKIASYYFLYRGTFISAITYPYLKLEIEHRKLEEANDKLKHLSDTMNDVLDALPIGIQKYDFNGRLVYMNSKFEEMLGCARIELCGNTFKRVLKMFPKVEKEKKRKHRSAQKDKKSTSNIFRAVVNMNGDKIKLNIKVQRIRNEILLVANDAKKEQELEDINLQTQTILNAVSNGILVVDREQKVILCNEAIEKITEMNSDGIIGVGVECLNEYLKLEIKQQTDKDLVEGDETNLEQVSITSKGGNQKEILRYTAPIQNVDGDIIGGITMITDVTNIKNEQQRMMQQEKLAMLGQMGAGIVHETRNYLTTIKGSCQLINMMTTEESTKRHTENINKNVDEVNRIISEFLFLSRPREPEMHEISLLDVFQSLKSMIETSSLVKGIDIDIKLSKEERYILCDEAQIKQVILNLCKNAIDAMGEKREGKIIVDTGYDELANEMYIRIIDNGRGISNEDLKKIGKPFFTTKKNGTGLGLSVCYGIIQRHGGRIEVKSNLGEGTTFTVFLPCMEDDELEGDNFVAISQDNELSKAIV